jgi:hypothetical protein
MVKRVLQVLPFLVIQQELAVLVVQVAQLAVGGKVELEEDSLAMVPMEEVIALPLMADQVICLEVLVVLETDVMEVIIMVATAVVAAV